MVSWRCHLACIILHWLKNSLSLYITVAPYILILFFATAFLHSLSFLSLFSASLLHISIQLLSYSPSTLISFWLSYSISQSNFQSSHYFYPSSTSLLPLSVFSRCVTLPSSLPLNQFCDNNIFFFWPIKHKSSKMSWRIDFLEIFIFATGIIRWSNFSIFIIIKIFIFIGYTY